MSPRAAAAALAQLQLGRQLHRFRQSPAGRALPYPVRVVLAMPGTYAVARALWKVERRHAAGEAVATALGRPYLRGPLRAQRIEARRRAEAEYRDRVARNCRCSIVPAEEW